MPIIAKDSGGEFTPHPEGMHQMVCIDVVDLGVLPTAFGDKHKINIRWQSAERNGKGQQLTVQKRYTLSLHEKSSLRSDLQAWRGKPFTAEEARGFDVEKLIGVNALVNVIHKKSDDGKVWANVAAVSPLMRGMAPIVADPDYVRESLRTPEPGEVPHDDHIPHPADTEEPPF
jgi:hypothetical protein